MREKLTILCIQASLALMSAGEAFAETTHIIDEHLEGEMENAFEVIPSHPVDGAPDMAHAAHGAAEAAHSAGLPQLDPTWYPSQIFWLAITFLVLYTLFSRSILPALSSTIESRREHIQNDLDTARKMKEEAEQVHAAYEEALNEARDKATEFMTTAEAKIKAKATKKLDDLREKSAQQTQEAEAALEKAKTKALKEMDAIAAEVASQAAKKIVGIDTDIKQAKSVIDNINKKAA